MIIPSVHGVMTYQKALDFAQMLDVRLIPYEREEGMEKTRRLIEAIEPGQSVGILIGPEGGFESAEVDSARTAGFESISLGRRILRTETAGLAFLSFMIYRFEL
jgi:16S rRNA (uracil1498-N3)-methyltransferase